MRIQLTAFAVLICTTTSGLAQSEFTFSLGAMQRSYSSDADLVVGISPTPILTSDQTTTTGVSFDSHLIGEQSWLRLMVYADDFDRSIVNSSGMGLAVQPNGVGLFGPFPFVGEFERDTGLLRFDVMQQFTTLAGVDLYGGVSLVDMYDNIDLSITTTAFPDILSENLVHGHSSLIGFVVGGRYDLDPGFGPEALNLSAFGTLGVYNATHSARYDATATGAGAPPTDERAFARETGITGAIELGLTASYALSDTTMLSLTYQAAFYGDSVNTPASVAQTNRAAGSSTVVETDSILYQGLSLSYVMRF